MHPVQLCCRGCGPYAKGPIHRLSWIGPRPAADALRPADSPGNRCKVNSVFDPNAARVLTDSLSRKRLQRTICCVGRKAPRRATPSALRRVRCRRSNFWHDWSDRMLVVRDGLRSGSPFPFRRIGERRVPDFGNHSRADHRLALASWFCLGLVVIAILAGVIALL